VALGAGRTGAREREDEGRRGNGGSRHHSLGS
jgi:hypothetical protein